MKLVNLGILFLMILVFGNAFAKQDKIIGNDSDSLVKFVMNQQYGNSYNKEFNCWEYVYQKKSDSIKYCVQPFEPTIVSVSDGERLYFHAKSVVPENDNQHVFANFAHIDEGLLGVFVLKKQASGEWDYLAKSKASYYGTWGNCCSSPVTLVKISNSDDYAWLFTSGGSWGGIIVSNYSLLFPKNTKIIDISRLPEVTESEQNYFNKLSIEPADTNNRFYPIRLTKIEEETKKKISSQVINFNEKSFSYDK